jgi:hypothetical protein
MADNRNPQAPAANAVRVTPGDATFPRVQINNYPPPH